MLAYFSVALSITHIDDRVSRTQRRRLNGIFEDHDVPCYLIGQLGKDDRHVGETDGTQILVRAIQACCTGHDFLGGRFVRVDCRNARGLVQFYCTNGFRLLQADDRTGLLQLVRYLP